MKLSKLRTRSAADGVDEEAMEEAADGDDEKNALIELLLARHLLSAASVGSNIDIQLRADLSAMKLSQIRKRAVVDGVDEDAMEDAADGEDENDALIELILQRELAQLAPVQTVAAEPESIQLPAFELEPSEQADASPYDVAELRAEVQGLRSKQLRHRATAEGLDEDAVEDALDTSDPKTALVELVVECIASRGPAERVLSLLEADGCARGAVCDITSEVSPVAKRCI